MFSDVPEPSFELPAAPDKRKSWHATNKVVTRCDFKRHLKISRHNGVTYITLWQRSPTGKSLTDIKQDPKMVSRFAVNLADAVSGLLGQNLDKNQFAIITAPRRRHLEKNFGCMVCEDLARLINLDFYPDVLTCKTRQRINAVFDVEFVPEQKNLIVIDDIVTTASTVTSIKKALSECRNLIFFIGIDNS